MPAYEPFQPYLSESEVAALPLQIEAVTYNQLRYEHIKEFHKRYFDAIFQDLQLENITELSTQSFDALDPDTLQRLVIAETGISAALGLRQEQEEILTTLRGHWLNGLTDFSGRKVSLFPRNDEPIRIEAAISRGSGIVLDSAVVRGVIQTPSSTERYDYNFRLRLKPDRRTRRRNQISSSATYFIDVLNPATGLAQFDLNFE